MKPYQGEDKFIIKQTPTKIANNLKIEAISGSCPATAEKEVEEVVDSASREDCNQKFSMTWLCETFVGRCISSQARIFETKSLVEEFGVKQRRIYDLMNIMEGCGCLRKLSKGRYQWMGLQQSEQISPESGKSDVTSLKQIAARIKHAFASSKDIVTFNQINDRLMEDANMRTLNPSSVRRRIYECCKVLRIVGYIDKIGKNYQWVVGADRPRAKAEPQPPRPRIKKRLKKVNLSEGQLIAQILKKYPSTDKLNNFLAKVTAAYEHMHHIKKEEVLYEQ